MKINIENCKDCKKTTADMKFFPYCSKKHWQDMVSKG